MRRRAQPAKATVKGERPPARKLRKHEGSRGQDLEKLLAEALEREAAHGRPLDQVPRSRVVLPSWAEFGSWGFETARSPYDTASRCGPLAVGKCWPGSSSS